MHSWFQDTYLVAAIQEVCEVVYGRQRWEVATGNQAG